VLARSYIVWAASWSDNSLEAVIKAKLPIPIAAEQVKQAGGALKKDSLGQLASDCAKATLGFQVCPKLSTLLKPSARSSKP